MLDANEGTGGIPANEIMAADYSRIHRLLKILMLIQGGNGYTPARLAQECGTTDRTIYRDLKQIQGAGVPMTFDKEKKSYVVGREFFMPPIELTLDESLALTALAEHIGRNQQIPFMAAASKAITKIRGQLPQSIRKNLDDIESHITIQLAASSSEEETKDVYTRVRNALSQKRALRCTYESLGSENNGKKKEFIFEPYALFFSTRAWYVIGHHGSHDETRCLKLNRFASVLETKQTYAIPKTFSLDKHLGNAWRMIRGKPTYEIQLHFDQEFAETIADTHWHKTQEIIWEDDQSIRFRCKVDGLDEIVWWILSMGPHCVVEKPTELADRVRELAGALFDRYRSAPVQSRKGK